MRAPDRLVHDGQRDEDLHDAQLLGPFGGADQRRRRRPSSTPPTTTATRATTPPIRIAFAPVTGRDSAACLALAEGWVVAAADGSPAVGVALAPAATTAGVPVEASTGAASDGDAEVAADAESAGDSEAGASVAAGTAAGALLESVDAGAGAAGASEPGRVDWDEFDWSAAVGVRPAALGSE